MSKFDIASARKPEDWLAKPIWLDPVRFPEYQTSRTTVFSPDNSPYCVARFRGTVSLDSPATAPVFASGDCRYRLCINGEYVGSGPAAVGGDYGNERPMGYTYYDRFDASFRAGENVIEAEVALSPGFMTEYTMGHGMFILESRPNGKPVATDSGWLAGVDRRFADPGSYDSRAGAELFPCAEVPNRWTLLPKDMPNLREERIGFSRVLNPFYPGRLSVCDGAVTVSAGGPVTFWLEFDKTYSAYPRVRAKGGAGASLTLTYEELPGKTGRSTEIVLSGDMEWRSLSMQSVHLMRVSLTNFSGEVALEPDIIACACPDDYNAGTFECSDEKLNRVYELGKWTTHICRQGCELDSPVHQETLGCTGDYMISSLISYYAFGDELLSRMDIIRTANWLRMNDCKMFHTSYSLMWIMMLADYERFSGDMTLRETCSDEIDGLVSLFKSYIGASGMIDNPPNYMFMDWVQVGNQNLHHPPKSMGQGYLTALYYGILRLLGRESELADSIRRSFRALWNPARGLYMDGKNDGSESANGWLPVEDGEFYSQHTNTFAVLFGLAPESERVGIMRRVMEDKSLTQAQPYFWHFIFEALDSVGLFDEYGVAAMERWYELYEQSPTGLKEVWGGFDCDFSHAWGATPSYQLPSKVLGVTPVEPGFASFRVEPKLGPLEWARGTVPTPHGTITVSVSRGGDGKLIVDCAAPDGCRRV